MEENQRLGLILGLHYFADSRVTTADAETILVVEFLVQFQGEDASITNYTMDIMGDYANTIITNSFQVFAKFMMGSTIISAKVRDFKKIH